MQISVSLMSKTLASSLTAITCTQRVWWVEYDSSAASIPTMQFLIQGGGIDRDILIAFELKIAEIDLNFAYETH